MGDELHCELSDDAIIIFCVPLPLSLSISSLSLFISFSLPFSLQRDFMFTFGGPLIDISESVPEGIKWPVTNSSSSNRSQDVQQSVCAIADYLSNHMPQIIGTFKKDPHDIMPKISAFNSTFKAAAVCAQLRTDPPYCEQRKLTLYDFQKKRAGLEILYYSRRWVEEFTNSTCVFGPLVWMKPAAI